MIDPLHPPTIVKPGRAGGQMREMDAAAPLINRKWRSPLLHYRLPPRGTAPPPPLEATSVFLRPFPGGPVGTVPCACGTDLAGTVVRRSRQADVWRYIPGRSENKHPRGDFLNEELSDAELRSDWSTGKSVNEAANHGRDCSDVCRLMFFYEWLRFIHAQNS